MTSNIRIIRPYRRTPIRMIGMICACALMITATAMIIFAMIAGMIDARHPAPNCPTEDSCAINYRDGEWIITPIIP